MAKRSSRYAAVPPTQRKPAERPLGTFAFADDTPMATVLPTLREPLLQAVLEILLEHHGFPSPNPPEPPIVVDELFIGQFDPDQHGRSLLRVTYKLDRTPPQRRGKPAVSPREVGKAKQFLAQIGAGSRGGVSLYWNLERGFC